MKSCRLMFLLVLFAFLAFAYSKKKLGVPGADVDLSEEDNGTSGADSYGGTDTGGGTVTDTSITTPCTAGAKRCAWDNVETCEAGVWVPTTYCDGGCESGSCLEFTSFGTCAEPLSLTAGVTVTGTTESTRNTYTWTEACRLAYGENPTGEETVYEFVVTEPAYYMFTVRPLEDFYAALYVRGICDEKDTQLRGACDGSGALRQQFEVTELLGSGSHYVFVDSFDNVGTFELTVERVTTPVCGYLIDQNPEIIDMAAPPIIIEDDTDDGFSLTMASETSDHQCTTFQTLGKELLYAFSLRVPSKLAISLTPVDPSTSSVAIYIRSDCNERYQQVMCDAARGQQLSTEVDLEAGAHYLFVDDLTSSTPDETQTFRLVLNPVPN